MSDRADDAGAYAFGPFRLDASARMLHRAGTEIALTNTMFDLLLCLVERPGMVVSKDDLFDAVWPNRIVEEANIRQTIFTLRRALGVDGERLIATVPGRGYRFTGSVQHLARVEQSARPASTDRGQASDRFLIGAAAAVLLMILIAAGLWWSHRTELGADGVAVTLADFDNRTHEPIFDRTLTDRLRVDLAQSPFVQTVPDQRQRDLLAAGGAARDTAITLSVAEHICPAAQAAHVVDGRIDKAAAGYAITLEARRCDGSDPSTETEEVAQVDDVAPAVDRLAARIRGDLGESAASLTRFSVPVARPSLAALKAYSDANWLMSHGKAADALPLDRTAIEIDPGFAQAYAHLGTIYETMLDKTHGAAALEQAYRLRASLPEHERLRIIALHNEYVTGDFDDMMADLRTWTQTYPRDAVAWTNLANAETYYGVRAQGVVDARRAVALGPTLEAAYVVLVRSELGEGNYAAARQAGAQAEARGVAGSALHRELLRTAIAAGDQPEIAREEAWSVAHAPGGLIAFVSVEDALRQGKARAASAQYETLTHGLPDKGLQAAAAASLARSLAEADMPAAARPLLASMQGAPEDDQMVAEALVGDRRAARAALDRDVAANPRNTLATRIISPQIRAAIALRDSEPGPAITAIRPALPFGERNLDVPYLLGEAFLADGQAGQAARVFRLMRAHRGWYPETVLYPMAELGLARALSAQGDRAGAVLAYKAVISEWREADADFPPLVQAKANLARLVSH